jgi:hypothetical protein
VREPAKHHQFSLCHRGRSEGPAFAALAEARLQRDDNFFLSDNIYSKIGMRWSATKEVAEHSQLQRTWSQIRTSFPWMVAIAFGIRVLCILLMHTYKVRTTEDNFGFGWEMGRIGASIASGHGFSNPFQTPTGLTAWEPPLTPYLMAGVFKLFGIYTRGAAFALLTINSAWSALTCIPVFLVARRSFG